MKKVVAAFLAGALMMVSVQAFGSSISQIGKKIQTEYTVTVDGQKLTVPAIAVDGKSYAPVRAIGEAAGYDVQVSGKSISLNKESAAVSNNIVNLPEPTPEVIPPVTDTKQSTDKEKAIAKLISLQSQYTALAGNIAFLLAQIDGDPTNTTYKQQLEEAQTKYNSLKAEYDQLKADSGL